MLKRWTIFILLALLWSCKQERHRPLDNPTQIDRYFPLKSFVEDQVNRLDNASVRKKVGIKGEQEILQQQFSAEEWRRELDVFVQADINKASLASAYETIKNDTLTLHRLKPGEKSSIQEIKVSYKAGKASRISFIAHLDSFFYTSDTQGELVLDSVSGMISSYRVIGLQEVWFLPVNEIDVTGEVL